MQMWAECQQYHKRPFTIDEILDDVWVPTVLRWKLFGEKLQSGNILADDVDRQLASTFQEQDEKLEREITVFGIPEKMAKLRISQIKQWRHLRACVDGALAILKLQTHCGLKGNFEPIRKIARFKQKTFEMNEFDSNLMKTCKLLQEITPDKSKCLETFCECGDFIKWLQESMRESGQKELKVFVDLAMSSVGDDQNRIVNVQCLHSAVIGYSPLIFDLKPEHDYLEVRKKCRIVWKEFSANPKLPKQLKDISSQLPWLKEIQKAHGSVKVTSLMQADAITSDGIFTVGFTQGIVETMTGDIITATLPQQDKQYDFRQLQDLQSRLMLVADRNQLTAKETGVSVEMYYLILDSVTRLGNVLRKLRKSGCVLFNSWKSQFWCRQDRRICVEISIGNEKDLPKLVGRTNQSEKVHHHIHAIAKFLEKCLDEWLAHIKQNRSEFYFLNFFTTDQLVILQQELAKMGSERMLSPHVFSLLSAVKNDCKLADLETALRAAQLEVHTKLSKQRPALDTLDNAEQTEDSDKKIESYNQRSTFVKELVNIGYDQTLAEMALDHVHEEDISSCDVSEAILWCMQQSCDKKEENMKTKNNGQQPNEQFELTAWNAPSSSTLVSIIETSLRQTCQKSDDGVRPLIRDLTDLWTHFLDSVSSSISDFIGLKHLGIFLKHLAVAENESVDRTYASNYKVGEPNLIVCPAGEILKVTLSIYMHDKKQALPLSDEVLVCHTDTTIDEIEIFWRRAVFADGRKIHCLVNADILNYDVGEAAERSLHDLILETYHKTDLKYRLFIICGSDNEYRCPLVPLFGKFIRQVQTVHQDAVKKYVEDKLVVPVNRIHSVSCVDFKRCSARLVLSTRAGVGKTLYVQRQTQAMKQKFARSNKVESKVVKIPLQEKHINMHEVIQEFLKHTPTSGKQSVRLFHIDISHEVQEGIDLLLFNLLILNCLMDKSGYVWRRSLDDFYLIETLPIMIHDTSSKNDYAHQIFSILPEVTCRSPTESFNIYNGIPQVANIGFRQTDQLFDEQKFRSPVFQRTYQYLRRLDLGKKLTDVDAQNPEGDPNTCLGVLLRRCGVINPSWSELQNFAWFLNTQLVDYENNQFVSNAASEDLPGYATFVLRFLMQMSKDFATRSIHISEESPSTSFSNDEDETMVDEDILNRLALRRTWESSPHPYLFFNSDHFTFTFLGFFIDKTTGNLIDLQTSHVLEQAIMAPNLYDALVRNRVPLQENFDNLQRDQKILKLCNVMGIDVPHDPDSTYELTTDNVKKILAIYMRFRSDIPVVIMGETGCGKTRLVKFMCALQCPPGVNVNNMILMKVHGGTIKDDIKRSIKKAEEQARQNVRMMAKYKTNIYTVLFFDEANTTEAIGLIKEVMCDKSMCGEPLKFYENLKIVAACNPYRKHPDELIHKLEQAGLGYHVDADETTDKLGRVPMRRLVYRVQPLPQSLLPLVWDFGQLNTDVEILYVRQMVKRYIDEDILPDSRSLVDVMSRILIESQQFMREQKDECSFVSLRDVQRALMVMAWFYEQAENNGVLFEMMNTRLSNKYTFEAQNSEDEDNHANVGLDKLTRSLVLALGVCYHACLGTEKRQRYRKRVFKCFRDPCVLTRGANQIAEEIECCQDVFLDNVSLDNNIARNTALKENVFMMVVCIELRIPLFLVGKPGSSKSLAKTIVADAMQGNCSKFKLFKHFKQVQMVSFQCSPLATPDGIVGTFRQCAQFQEDKDLNTFVSVVVLDEVGLAEDSPRMPLKTLHPLLEDGCQGEEEPKPFKKVAFIGISNWALDPAKMNRGIFVQREVPEIDELTNSAQGICHRNKVIQALIKPFIGPLSKAYLDVFNDASKQMREFYGLRDFYSLVKMVCDFVEESKQPPTWFEMLHAIKRNFGGLEMINPEIHFKRHLRHVMTCSGAHRLCDPDCSPKGLIEACLFNSVQFKGESRYLLLLTENYGALSIIQQQIFSKQREIRPITIFGSSFRSDQEYTQVCRNINQIKICMETGNTVLLLNLENLYESLYDALNQYYVYFGGVRYVDLGLGTHRVKCPVHQDFRLIVVAEKQIVYKKFPIPLINRLEKHFLTINSILDERQIQLAKKLQEWAHMFATETNDSIRGPTLRHAGDVFIGFHEDTCSAIILHVFEKNEHNKINDQDVIEKGKQLLLWCATPESLVCNSQLDQAEKDRMTKYYYERQAHDSFIHYLKHVLEKEKCKELFAQLTCHSKLLAGNHAKEILKEVTMFRRVEILSLSLFDTEQQFSIRVQQTLTTATKEATLLIIQCDSGDVNAKLISSARYCVISEVVKIRDHHNPSFFVVFIVQLPRKAGGCFSDFQCGVWHSAHIDDLFVEDDSMPPINYLVNKRISDIFSGTLTHQHPGPVDTKHVMGTFKTLQDVSDEHIDIRNKPENMEIEIYSRDRDRSIAINDITIPKAPSLYSMQHATYMWGLVRHCVQPALSMVKNLQNTEPRETKRVDIVLRALPECSSDMEITHKALFTNGLVVWIVKLFKEKERETGFLSDQWLIRNAAAMRNINKNGTLRRSCYNTIVSKVAPVFANVFAFLDTNSNMDLIECDIPWKREVWLKCLNLTHVLPLKYTDCHSLAGADELKDLLVKGTGFEGHGFKLRFPFSWVVIDVVDELVRDIVIDAVEVKEMISKCVTALKASPVGQILSQFSSSTQPDPREILQDYIHDFVQTVYNAGTDSELNIVCEQIMSRSISVANEIGGSNDLICHSICCRFAYEEMSFKLTFFRCINNVWPSCSSKIVEIRNTTPGHFMFKEHEFTFSALCMLLEELTPKPNELDKTTSRQDWISKVYTYRHVVETMLNIKQNDVRYGLHSENTIRRARSLWSRVLAMKLFIENMCVPESEQDITIRNCMPLWKLLGDDVDLGGPKSFSAVETFLKICNLTALKETIGSEVKCYKCEENIQCAPVTLPCQKNDKICQTCFTEMKALRDFKCPLCKEPFPIDWVPTNEEDTILENKLRRYQQRCNTFFLEVVSQLSFAYGNASEQVITKLLGYVTCKTKTGKVFTKNISMIDTGLDPNPVFRSFLLRMLLKSREERYVSSYISQFLESTTIDTDTNPKERIDIYLLIVQCWEDTQLQYIEQSGESRLTIACDLFRDAFEKINNHQSLTELLYGIATARACLSETARCLAELAEEEKHTITGDMLKIIQAAKELCHSHNKETLKVYLLKILCRRYGIHIYQRLSKSRAHSLNWVAFEGRSEQMQVEVADRYIVLGETYTRVREAIAKTLLGEDSGILQDLLQKIQSRNAHLETVVQLAVHREVTCAHVRQSFTKPKKEIERLHKLLVASEVVEDKELMQRLLNNNLQPPLLVMKPQSIMEQQGVQCLMTHFKITMSKLQDESTLLFPFKALIDGNLIIQSMFLPTMPQDDLDDIHNAMLRNRGGENPVVYRCPKGHPYLIGDCGRPDSTGFCPECREQIGGAGHQALPGNVLNNQGDTTKRGHVLGRSNKSGIIQPERDMKPTYCTAVRLFLHMALYLGPVEDIQKIIQPEIPANHVSQFLLDHINANIVGLQKALDRSPDDIILLMHVVVHHMMHQAGKALPQRMTLLSSKADRKAWENEFCSTVLRNVLGSADLLLTNLNNGIATDQRLGADPLMCLIYETDNTQGSEDTENLLNVPRMWRFRIPITIEHMRQVLDSKIQDLNPKPRVLQRFLLEDDILQALQYLPNIMLLQRALLQKLQKKLDRAEANAQLKVRDIKKNNLAGHDTERWIDDFSKAWEMTRLRLSPGCATKFGRVNVPEEFCRERITDNTPLAVLLPATNGPGLCSYAMLDLLFRKQNEVIDFYGSETERLHSLSSIAPMAVTSAHLISYDHEHDLMPLVLANCHYSFEMGVGTKIEYDFAGMERQLIDRLLYSKSKIEIHQYLKVDLMVYRTEVTNVSVFNKLRGNIPQEHLNPAVKKQIFEELRSLPDVCESLDNLDIAISFLKTTGGDPAMPLHRFIEETLQMDKSLLSQKARQICELRHARSLWLLLSFLKSRLLVDYRHATEAVFETLPNGFYEDLPDVVKSSFGEYMNNLSTEKLSNLLELLHEFLILRVSVQENPDDDDFVDTNKYRLFESLKEYIELSESPALEPVIFNGSPTGLLYEHGAKAWVLAYETLLRKIGTRRRS
ncbi:E3 ubiquitin-protein ligase RNF213-like [Dreissena polymorpha]|uniref:E3 ubiquitin-protein ligase RNF213-like n=1 Tax=Dreissena polymorpha TaxID=45954 RepID=UPI002264AA83|nr:E3 ubiquitin-protein ligase RNF213-like [Dreissena polymorpha]